MVDFFGFGGDGIEYGNQFLVNTHVWSYGSGLERIDNAVVFCRCLCDAGMEVRDDTNAGYKMESNTDVGLPWVGIGFGCLPREWASPERNSRSGNLAVIYDRIGLDVIWAGYCGALEKSQISGE